MRLSKAGLRVGALRTIERPQTVQPAARALAANKGALACPTSQQTI
jgi:hypothetical protein